MRAAVDALFEHYARSFNTALDGDVDLDAVLDQYTDVFIAANPAGLATGEQGEPLRQAMLAGFEHYRATGTRRMEVRALRLIPIDDLHGLAFVDWVATYTVRGGSTLVPFTNAYLVRVEHGRARVFGWITGDEAAVLKEYGIVG